MGTTDWIAIGRLDELAGLEAPAHRIDARAKIVVVAAFVAAVMSFPRQEISALTPFLLYPVALMALGDIPARPILRRMLVALPFALVVGMFNPILDRQPVAEFGPFVVTAGWISLASILLRFCLTVGAALALVACTGLPRLGRGLGQLGVPRVFVVQLLFCYRYLFVVADESARMMRAVALRTEAGRSLRLRTYGSLLGSLLLRSLDRADRVHRAMVARGFTGEFHTPCRASLRASDWAFMAGWLAYFGVARTWNLADGLGRLVAGLGS